MTRVLDINSVDCTVILRGNKAFIGGLYPLNLLRQITSYEVEGARFSEAFRRKRWDGRSHLFNSKERCFPSGLLHLVIKEFKIHDDQARIQLRDERIEPTPGANGFDLLGIKFGEGRYSYQLASAQAAVEKKQGILKLATGSGKTEVACAITKHLALPTLFLVMSRDLMHQSRLRFSKRLGLRLEDIGIIGDNEFQLGEWITVATVESLLNRIELPEVQEYVKKWQLLVADEVHQSGADHFYALLDLIPATYRFGLSGTPLYRTDGANLRLMAQTGDIIYEVSNKELIDLGISSQVTININKVNEPKLLKKLKWPEVLEQGIIENEHHKAKAIERTLYHLKQKRNVVVMVERRRHGEALEKALKLKFPKKKIQYIHGDEPTEVRSQAIKDLEDKKIQCLITTKILDTGIDTPAIDVLVFAYAGKSKIQALQRIGRGLRKSPTKTMLYVEDIFNTCHRYLADHSLERLSIYKEENCFTINVLD